MVFRQRPNVPFYLRTHLLLQLPFGLLGEWPTLMLLSLSFLKLIRVVAEAKVAKGNFILMTLVALQTLMFAWHYSTLYYMAINEASLIVVKSNQLLDATICSKPGHFAK